MLQKDASIQDDVNSGSKVCVIGWKYGTSYVDKNGILLAMEIQKMDQILQ